MIFCASNHQITTKRKKKKEKKGSKKIFDIIMPHLLRLAQDLELQSDVKTRSKVENSRHKKNKSKFSGIYFN